MDLQKNKQSPSLDSNANPKRNLKSDESWTHDSTEKPAQSSK